ncbi:phage head closure protein [Orbus wheelerorum]|uniref:phage head closure protein n=1 Tax=Orbus wheelerorum TaxID=3074111 RepID=UPI00370D4824
MKSGKLRHRITIQKKISSKTGTGSIKVKWEDVCKVWASVEPSSVKEFLTAQSIKSEVTAKIIIRYNKNIVIDSTMRILYRDKIYNIAGVLADLNSGLDYLTLPVSEGVNNG